MKANVVGLDAIREAAEAAAAEPHRVGAYTADEYGTTWWRTTNDGATPVVLANFTARIVADVARDDGAEVSHVYEIEAALRGRTVTCRVPAAQFERMGWVAEALGASAVFSPGQGTRDRLRHAIQTLSEDVPQRRVYAQTGWRKVGGRWAYLHASGAVGPDGTVVGIETDLPRALEAFDVPPPPTGERRRAAIRASLRLSEVAPLSVTLGVYGATVTAPLGRTDFTVGLVGHTGAGKTELAALCQQHFGAGFDGRHLPCSWLSTANAVEATAFAAADALLVVDDFAPSGTQNDVSHMHREAARVIRAQGNRAGRMRMAADGSLRPEKPPRGVLLVTAEDLPRGESIRGRMLVAEVSGLLGKPGADIDAERLSACQRDAGAGLYAEAMSAYLQWLAPRLDAVRRGLARRRAALRTLALTSGTHSRTPDAIAAVGLGLGYFLRFAAAAGALSRAEAKDRWVTWWLALREAAAAQAVHQQAQEPTRRFLALLSAAIASGKAHVARPDGTAPAMAEEACGWRVAEGGTAEPQGTRIGWIDGGDVLLEPEASYAAAQALGAQQGEPLGVSTRALHRALFERGVLASTEERGGDRRLTVRRMVGGRRIAVVHLSAETMGLLVSPTTGPTGPMDAEAYTANGETLGRNGKEPAHRPTNRPTTGPGLGRNRPIGPVAGPVENATGPGIHLTDSTQEALVGRLGRSAGVDRGSGLEVARHA